MRATQTFQNKPTDHLRGIMKLGIPQAPHYPTGVKLSIIKLVRKRVEKSMWKIFCTIP